tara:strand:+ start:104 stop:286 length:183 start_codon:yes stop_codon:yes gene_type:complete
MNMDLTPMHDSSLDLFTAKAEEEAHKYAMDLESKAAELEVTVDYYLEEFHDINLEMIWED